MDVDRTARNLADYEIIDIKPESVHRNCSILLDKSNIKIEIKEEFSENIVAESHQSNFYCLQIKNEEIASECVYYNTCDTYCKDSETLIENVMAKNKVGLSASALDQQSVQPVDRMETFKAVKPVGSDNEPKSTSNTQSAVVRMCNYTCDICNRSLFSSNAVVTHKRISHGIEYPRNVSKSNISQTIPKCKELNKDDPVVDIDDPSVSTLDQQSGGTVTVGEPDGSSNSLKPAPSTQPVVLRMCEHTCDICNKLFFSYYALLAHKRLRHGETVPRNILKSNISQKHGIKPSDSLDKPKLSTNSGSCKSTISSHECNICNKSFFSESKLMSHRKSHIFTCSVCKETFTDKQTLHLHKQTHFEGKQIYCKICKKYIPYSYYCTHKRNHAVVVEAFGCNICNKSFKRNYNLTKHKETHN